MAIGYTDGQVTLTTGSAEITGVGTAWAVGLVVSGVIYVEAEGNPLPFSTVQSDTAIIADIAWTGPTGTYDYVLIRDRDAQLSRNTETLARLLAGMEAGTLWKYDAEGLTADRAFYDTKPRGFGFLDVSAAPAKLWIKASNAEGDWAGPFQYGQGEPGPRGIPGPFTSIAVGEVTTAPPGTPASVEAVPTGPGAIELNFDIPKGYDGDTVGPAGAVPGHVAVFADATGKALADGGAPFSKSYNDLTDKPALGNSSSRNVGMVAGSVAAGDDARFAEIGKNDSALALTLADLTGQRVGMVGGFSDSYRDTLGVRMPSGGRDINTVSLLHFDGPSGKKTVADSAYEDFSSGSPRHLWTPQGTFAMSDEQSKFGGFSAKFDGTTLCGLRGDGSADFAFPTGQDFTIEMWVYRNVVGVNHILWDGRSSGAAALLLDILTTNLIRVYVSTAQRIASTTAILANIWYHIALVRYQGQTKLYVNGVQEGAVYADATAYPNTGNSPAIGMGDAAGATPLNGYIDEFRVSRVARWTENFVPPTAPYDSGPTSTKAALYDAAGFQWYPRELKAQLMTLVNTRTASAAVATTRTDRTVISAAMLRRNAGRVRLRFRGPISGTPKEITDVFIGHKADTGNAWDMDPATITRVTFGGANGLIPAVGSLNWSDWIVFPLNATNDLVVSYNVAAASGVYDQCALGVGMMTHFHKASATEADQAAPAGYTALTAGTFYFLDSIEGKDAAPFYDDMWVESTTVLATAVPSKVRLVLQIAGNAVLTPNDDFVGEVSRDGGTTWTPVTLALSSQLANYRTYAGIADVSGQPAGTSMKYRVRNVGGKLAILAGAVQQWGNV